jgi:hypothetical protein
MAEDPKNLVRLDEEDWSALFPGEIVPVGNKQIMIKPLSLEQISDVLIYVKKIAPSLQEAGINLVNFDDPSNIPVIVNVFLKEAPDIMEALVGIHRDDITRLPFAKAVELCAVALRVNAESQESLVKNLTALATDLTQMVNGASVTQSNSSLAKATIPGKKSKVIPSAK